MSHGHNSVKPRSPGVRSPGEAAPQPQRRTSACTTWSGVSTCTWPRDASVGWGARALTCPALSKSAHTRLDVIKRAPHQQLSSGATGQCLETQAAAGQDPHEQTPPPTEAALAPKGLGTRGERHSSRPDTPLKQR